ncbi:amidohydrolase family protein [Leifsonia sp. NPDC058230]|uniref:amidohydrolase family protein n=1 Tax=Leifsonia sp. NPDC058230 TaxID=3346391 RepID=UPI0036DE034B
MSRRIDAHLHLWDRTDGGYDWIAKGSALDATFSAADARAELDRAGIDAAVVVQADESARDTEFLLACARRYPWVAGVVGWLPIEHPAVSLAVLDALGVDDRLCGIRVATRDSFLERASVRDTLFHVAERGLAFDVPAVWPRHFDDVEALADAVPELTIVLDHLGKPPLADRSQAKRTAWRDALARLAMRPNVFAKVSGLRNTLPEGSSLTTAIARPAWDAALETFGVSRLMYGGDWPITVAFDGYQPVFETLASLAAELSDHEQNQFFGGTAEQVYSLSVIGAGPMTNTTEESKQ